MQLANDTNISFGMLKKSRLTNFEKVFADTFKVPLEKMNTKSDLYKWSEDLFIKETSKKLLKKELRINLICGRIRFAKY